MIAVALGGRDENGKLTPSTSRPANRILFGKWPGTECVRSHLGRVCFTLGANWRALRIASIGGI